MNKRRVKYSGIPKEIQDEIIARYLAGETNVSELLASYDRIPYSTGRRFVHERIEEMGLEEVFEFQHFNVADFPYLSIGDTFQFADNLTVWKVMRVSKKESDDVFVLVPSPNREYGSKHFINEDQIK